MALAPQGETDLRLRPTTHALPTGLPQGLSLIKDQEGPRRQEQYPWVVLTVRAAIPLPP